MSEKTIPEQIRSLGRYYAQSHEGNLTLRAEWLLEAVYAAERILTRVEEEIQQVQVAMCREDAEAAKGKTPC